MELRIAKVISFIFHPLFIPFYTILFFLITDSYLSFTIPLKSKLMLVVIVLLTTILLPLFTSLLLIRMKIIHSIFPKNREERIYLLFNSAIFYYLAYYILKGTHVSVVLNYFMLGSTLLVICSMVISFFQRISLHMIATGGLLGGLFGLSFRAYPDLTGVILGMIFLAGLIGYARLKIDSQNPAEIYYGFLAGTIVMFLLFILI